MISVIIASLNENNDILNKTIESIKNSSGNRTEIIVIDDCSDCKVEINYDDVVFIRNDTRLGAAKSKDKGIKLSKNPYIFITDAHMIFKDGWYDEVLKSLENKPKSLYCGVCLGLSETNFDLNKCEGAYVGARLFLKEGNEFVDGKWSHIVSNESDYEISCVMGACYFMHKSWYEYIKGYDDLIAWGSEEPCLSIKTWLSGGDVRINKKIKIGHMFRNNAPYYTEIHKILYNKIRMVYCFFPEELSNDLITKMSSLPFFNEAIELINNDEIIINEYKKYYKSIFAKDIYWLIDKFKINMCN